MWKLDQKWTKLEETCQTLNLKISASFRPKMEYRFGKIYGKSTCARDFLFLSDLFYIPAIFSIEGIFIVYG